MSGTMQRRSSFQQRTGGDRPLEARHNVAIEISAYILADPKGRTSMPDKDAVKGRLLHDVPEWNMTAKFDAEGRPTTEVTVVMPMPKDGKGEGRRDIFGLSKTKGNGPAMDPGSIVVFERAYHAKSDATDADGTFKIKAPYAHGCVNSKNLNEELGLVLPSVLVSVRPEGEYTDRVTKETKPSGRVDVLIADQNLATLVSDEADLRGKVNELVQSGGMGNPGFQLLARELAPQGADDTAKAQLAADINSRVGGYSVSRGNVVLAEDGKPKLDDEGKKLYVADTGDQLFDRFFRDNPDLKQLLGNPAWQIEMVPLMAINQAPSLVPSKVKKGDNVRDNSPLYGIYGEVSDQDTHAKSVVTGPGDKKFGMIDCGWQPSHAVCARMDKDSDYWMSTYQRPTKQPSDVLSIHDVVTPLTPDYHVDAIKAVAALNVEGKKGYYAAAKAEPEAAPAPGPR